MAINHSDVFRWAESELLEKSRDVLALPFSLIDSVNCDLRWSPLSNSSDGLHNQKRVPSRIAKSKLASIEDFKCGLCVADNAAHPLYLNISFRIDFKNCSSWLSDSASDSSPPHMHNLNSFHPNDFGGREENWFSFLFDIGVIRSGSLSFPFNRK